VATAPTVAMISETLARRYFGGQDPLGQRLRLGRLSQEAVTIVGVVADVKNYENSDGPEAQIYVPFAQRPGRDMVVVLRAASNPEALAATARGAVAALDPAEPVSHLFSMDTLIGFVTAPTRITATFVAFFGAVALLLAAVGVYGVLTYVFAQRTREVGIRMALGATRGDIAALVLRQLRGMLVIGLVPGLVLAWVLGHAMKAMLFGVTPSDWRVYVAMSLVLACAAVLATFFPARRVTATNPLAALRYE
jgi:putative ABC transport system permease protein